MRHVSRPQVTLLGSGVTPFTPEGRSWPPASASIRARRRSCEEFLPGHRDAGLTEINEAWRAGGHGGKVSESLVSRTRSRLKIPKKRTASGGDDGGSKAKGKAKPSPKGEKGEKTANAQEFTSQPESRAGGSRPNKTAFIREQLGRENTLDFRAINRAWSAAGHEGEISDNLVYKTRASMGIKGRRAAQAGSQAVVAGPEPSAEAAHAPSATEAGPAVQRSNGRHATPPSSEVTRPLSAGVHVHELHEIEGEIDELMFRLRGLGDFSGVLQALRTARRLLVRSHGD